MNYSVYTYCKLFTNAIFPKGYIRRRSYMYGNETLNDTTDAVAKHTTYSSTDRIFVWMQCTQNYDTTWSFVHFWCVVGDVWCDHIEQQVWMKWKRANGTHALHPIRSQSVSSVYSTQQTHTRHEGKLWLLLLLSHHHFPHQVVCVCFNFRLFAAAAATVAVTAHWQWQ